MKMCYSNHKILVCSIFLLLGCQTPRSFFTEIGIEQQLLIAKANSYLQEEPVTITAFPAERSAGGLHDYYSEGKYWWPNPEDPEGPYIRRDGYSNPDNFTDHRRVLGKLSNMVTTLVAAYKLTRDEKYAKQALKHLNAWFVQPATRMNPSLLYGQAIKGINTGRGIGIIDTCSLINVAKSILYLVQSGFLTGEEQRKLKGWFGDYANWLTTHAYGIDERDNNNNHSTWWGAQVAAYAQLAGREDLLEICRNQFKKQLDIQMSADGSFPDELARTRPYHYTLYNLDAWTTFCLLASSQEDNLWQYQSPHGTLRKAIDFMAYYYENPTEWTFPTELEPEVQPERNDFLIFASMGYDEAKYLNLWKKSEAHNRATYAHLYLWQK